MRKISSVTKRPMCLSAGYGSFSIPTKAGIFSATVTPRGVLTLEFPGVQRPKRRTALCRPLSAKTALLRGQVAGALRDYFSGKLVAFSRIPVDFSQGRTPFAVKVLKTLRRVPYGTMLTYGDLARRAGFPGRSRAVGRIMGSNRVPVILPCHRVVAARGALGGYSAGLKWKKRLLALERSCMQRKG